MIGKLDLVWIAFVRVLFGNRASRDYDLRYDASLMPSFLTVDLVHA